MPSIGLSVLDWLIIAIYFAFILGLGYYLKRFTKSQEDFFMAGRKNSAWVAGIAFLSANLGALELLGMTGNTFKYGMYVAHFYWIGAIPAMLFLGVYMMPFYYSSRIHSVPGYLKLRFDEKTRVLNAIAFAIMTVLVSGINLYAMALVLHTFLGWNWDISMWVSAATVAVYVTMSGLLSAIFTEIVQFFLIWFGLFLVAILGIIEIGGINEVFARVQGSYNTLWSTSARSLAERHGRDLGRYRAGPRVRVVVRLLDDRLPCGAAGILGEGSPGGTYDTDHRVVLQDGRAVHRHRGRTRGADPGERSEERIRAAQRRRADQL